MKTKSIYESFTNRDHIPHRQGGQCPSISFASGPSNPCYVTVMEVGLLQKNVAVCAVVVMMKIYIARNLMTRHLLDSFTHLEPYVFIVIDIIIIVVWSVFLFLFLFF